MSQNRTPSQTPEVSARRAAMASDAGSNGGSGGNTFDGTGDYITWKRGATITALLSDDALSGAKAVFRLIKGNAVAALTADLDLANTSSFPFANAQAIFTALEKIYGDPSEAQRGEALRQLARLRQSHKAFEEFLLDFTILAVQAGLSSEMKISMMRAAVSSRLATAAATIDDSDFGTYVMKLRRADQMIPREQKKNFRTTEKRGKGRGTQTRDMSKVDCYGCGETGHLKRDCKKKAKATKTSDDDTEDIVEHLGND
jgi:hypothetical protein